MDGRMDGWMVVVQGSSSLGHRTPARLVAPLVRSRAPPGSTWSPPRRLRTERASPALQELSRATTTACKSECVPYARSSDERAMSVHLCLCMYRYVCLPIRPSRGWVRTRVAVQRCCYRSDDDDDDDDESINRRSQINAKSTNQPIDE